MSEQNTETMTLLIEARGEVIVSNFPEFAQMARKRLGEVNRDLKTDEDFGEAELQVKGLSKVESALKMAKEKALEDAQQLHTLFSQIDELGGEMAKARLELSKQITKRKEEIRDELVAEALELVNCEPRLRKSVYGASVAAATKGKRTVESMRKALDVCVACHNASIRKSREAIGRFIAENGLDLVMDKDELELKAPESVAAELRRRHEAKKAEEERVRLEKETARANADANAAKKALEEANKPPAQAPEVLAGDSPFLPTRNPVPAGPTETELEERNAAKTAIAEAFRSLKEIFESMSHPVNRQRAEIFRGEINAAWRKFYQ